MTNQLSLEPELEQELAATVAALSVKGKGILAADESTATIGKRFDQISLDNTEEQRCAYRTLLATTPGLADYVSGVILFEETLNQVTPDGKKIAELFSQQGIVVGVKVDQGLLAFKPGSAEQLTLGLGGLRDRLVAYKALGAKFAKWRAVYTINQDASLPAEEKLPTEALVDINSQLLALYAAECQELGIVPIIEPEVLMTGKHDLATCAAITEQVLRQVFQACEKIGLRYEYAILKPNMVTPGSEFAQQNVAPSDASGSNAASATLQQMDSAAIAAATVKVLDAVVPSEIPSINFLSGGQSAIDATINLQAINAVSKTKSWHLSFSYGRALQADCLRVWAGKPENIQAAQAELLKQARNNHLATLGQYQA